MIFLDRSIPKSVAEALKMVRTGDVMWLEDRYPHNAKDEEWIPDAGRAGWLVIARDKKIRTRSWQRELIRRHGVGCFIINQTTRDPTRWEYLKLLAKTLDEMERLHAERARPFMYLVDSAGGLSDFPLSRSGAAAQGSP